MSHCYYTLAKTATVVARSLLCLFCRQKKIQMVATLHLWSCLKFICHLHYCWLTTFANLFSCFLQVSCAILDCASAGILCSNTRFHQLLEQQGLKGVYRIDNRVMCNTACSSCQSRIWVYYRILKISIKNIKGFRNVGESIRTPKSPRVHAGPLC